MSQTYEKAGTDRTTRACISDRKHVDPHQAAYLDSTLDAYTAAFATRDANHSGQSSGATVIQE